jgi:hypothetical protein
MPVVEFNKQSVRPQRHKLFEQCSAVHCEKLLCDRVCGRTSQGLCAGLMVVVKVETLKNKRAISGSHGLPTREEQSHPASVMMVHAPTERNFEIVLPLTHLGRKRAVVAHRRWWWRRWRYNI